MCRFYALPAFERVQVCNSVAAKRYGGPSSVGWTLNPPLCLPSGKNVRIQGVSRRLAGLAFLPRRFVGSTPSLRSKAWPSESPVPLPLYSWVILSTASWQMYARKSCRATVLLRRPCRLPASGSDGWSGGRDSGIQRKSRELRQDQRSGTGRKATLSSLSCASPPSSPFPSASIAGG